MFFLNYFVFFTYINYSLIIHYLLNTKYLQVSATINKENLNYF